MTKFSVSRRVSAMFTESRGSQRSSASPPPAPRVGAPGPGSRATRPSASRRRSLRLTWERWRTPSPRWISLAAAARMGGHEAQVARVGVRSAASVDVRLASQAEEPRSPSASSALATVRSARPARRPPAGAAPRRRRARASGRRAARRPPAPAAPARPAPAAPAVEQRLDLPPPGGAPIAAASATSRRAPRRRAPAQRPSAPAPFPAKAVRGVAQAVDGDRVDRGQHRARPTTAGRLARAPLLQRLQDRRAHGVARRAHALAAAGTSRRQASAQSRSQSRIAR